jgi:carboxymethylenebutenolidase
MVPEERDAGDTDHLSRRQAIATAVGGTFALAVRPVSAATITTSGEGLDTADVKIPTASGAIPGYRAMPANGTKKGAKGFPAVLVVQEIFGVHEHIRDVCRRLAKQGYYAIAPELYFRQGDVSKLSEYKDIREIVAKVPDAQVLGDLDAAAAFAKASGEADMGRLGITGFCWGGRIVWLYAAHSAAPRAGVAWYGRLAGEKNPLQPQHPLDVAGAVHAPVLGLYGAEDQSIPVATVEEMRKALAAGSPAARASEIKVYPGAGHAFHADYRPTYKKEAAEDGWGRLLAWFKAHGVAP